MPLPVIFERRRQTRLSVLIVADTPTHLLMDVRLADAGLRQVFLFDYRDERSIPIAPALLVEFDRIDLDAQG